MAQIERWQQPHRLFDAGSRGIGYLAVRCQG